MTDYCNHMLYCETALDPAVYCADPTVEGSDFCEYHLDEE